MTGLGRLTAAILVSLSVLPAMASSAVAAPSGAGQTSAALTPSAVTTTVVRAYFLLADPAGGTARLVPVLRRIAPTSARAHAAMDALLAGPSRREASADPAIRTALRGGTRLLGLRVESGTAIVNLDPAFLDGASARVTRGRAAQVTYTLTQFSTITRVRILVGGRALPPVTGLPTGTFTRTTFRDEWLPAIFVDRPAWGSLFESGTRVSGLTNVFEAQFRLRVIAENGRVLLDRAVLADLPAGSGGWRAFSVPISYRVTTYQNGTVRVYDPSEVDGHAQDIRDYPVLLDPD
jgi:sporulation and spore germination protein/immunoglobulin-like protein involved in spore germination